MNKDKAWANIEDVTSKNQPEGMTARLLCWDGNANMYRPANDIRKHCGTLLPDCRRNAERA
jgi:hypothetical protein